MQTPPSTFAPLLEWQAPARPDHQRTQTWYLIAGLISGSMIIYGLLTGSWTMSVAVALVSGVYYLVRNERYKVHSVRILRVGIELDGQLYDWHRWKNFWILVGPEYGELHVAGRGWHPELVVQTGSVDPFALRDTLLEYLPQNPNQKERLLDAITRFCKL